MPDRALRILGLLLALWLPSGGALGWGEEGHRIAGAIAHKHLTPEARRQVFALLKDDRLADGQRSHRRTLGEIAYWADEIKDTPWGRSREDASGKLVYQQQVLDRAIVFSVRERFDFWRPVRSANSVKDAGVSASIAQGDLAQDVARRKGTLPLLLSVAAQEERGVEMGGASGGRRSSAAACGHS